MPREKDDDIVIQMSCEREPLTSRGEQTHHEINLGRGECQIIVLSIHSLL